MMELWLANMYNLLGREVCDFDKREPCTETPHSIERGT